MKVEKLRTYYFTRYGVVKAVDNVTFEIYKGETLGLVGESGCGKSTLGFSIMKLVPPPGRIVDGKIIFEGKNLVEASEDEMRKIRGKKIAMIFQDPMTSLNPLMRIGDHIVELILTHEKTTKEKALEKAEKLLDELEFPAKE